HGGVEHHLAERHSAGTIRHTLEGAAVLEHQDRSVAQAVSVEWRPVRASRRGMRGCTAGKSRGRGRDVKQGARMGVGDSLPATGWAPMGPLTCYPPPVTNHEPRTAKSLSNPLVFIYADESCLGNQYRDQARRGGAAALIEYFHPARGCIRRDQWTSEPHTTNNRSAT